MGKGTAAEAAVAAVEDCMQFPCKGKTPVNTGVTGHFTPENHPEHHDTPGNGTAGTARTTDANRES
jgi:hypothetical protein